MKKKTLKGTITSTKMLNTAVVKVETVKVHKKYKKRYITHKKYKVQADIKSLKVGDNVTIEESRPYSKTKTWTIKNPI